MNNSCKIFGLGYRGMKTMLVFHLELNIVNSPYKHPTVVFKISIYNLLTRWRQPSIANLCDITSFSKPIHQFCSHILHQSHYRIFSCFPQNGVPSLCNIAWHYVVPILEKCACAQCSNPIPIRYYAQATLMLLISLNAV